MNMRVIRKAIGLLIVDIVIIIGIFIIQFRTDSSILKKIGNLQVTMMKSDSEDSEFELKNKLEVNYNGISIHSDDQNSIKIIKKGESVGKTIQLIDYEEGDLQYTFHFSEDVNITVMLANNETNAPLTIFADVPKTITDVYVPFNFAFNMKVQKDEGKNIILEGKKQVWSFRTDDISDNFIHFTYADNLAHYSVYDDSKRFSFEDIIELAGAHPDIYQNTITALTDNLINAFKTSINDNNLSEQAVVAYISAMSQRGYYKQAIEEIPQEYKKSDSRTYLSSPFLNNLSSMNRKLESDLSDVTKDFKYAASTGSLDIFTINDFAKKICITPDRASVIEILNNAAKADMENCTVAQVSGFLLAYTELSSLCKEYAAILEPILEDCIVRLTAACTYQDNVLTISENDTFLSVVQAVQVGTTLLRYGEAIGNDIYIKAGRVLINSYISESSSFDLRTLSTIYPMIAYDNWYYPHIELINSVGKDAIWAWTCAKDIAYSKDSEGALVLSIDFPLEYTHYVIFKGIPAFEQIFIYDMAFRTDPRFETYNSSGYVYKADTETLLLKSRHKSVIENVRMSYVARKPAPKPQETEVKTETTTTENSTAGSSESTASSEGANGAGPSTGSGTAYSSVTTSSTGTASTSESASEGGPSTGSGTAYSTGTTNTTTE